MGLWMADPPLFSGAGEGLRQIIELVVAFGLTSLIGLERQLQGKSAGYVRRALSARRRR
ncbi:hypothetical protein ACVWWN_002010 [Mycobacterium sp. URHB0021]|jgi:putative Mg2+ transporter-C (MgtC) family protein